MEDLFRKIIDEEAVASRKKKFEKAKEAFAGTHSGAHTSGGADEAFKAYMKYGKDGSAILDLLKEVPDSIRPHVIERMKTICESAKAGILSDDDTEILKEWIESIRKIIKGLNEVIVEIVSGLSGLDAAPEMLAAIQKTRDKFVTTLDFISQAVITSEEASDATEGRSGSEPDTGVREAGEEVEGSPGDS